MVISFLVLWSICLSFFWSISRMVQSILRVGQPRYLSLRQGSCFRILSRVISDSFEIFFIIFFHFHMFDGVSFQYPQLFVGVLLTESFDYLIWSFDSFRHVSFATFHYNHGAFLCQIPFLYLCCIFSQFVLGFPILFCFWQKFDVVQMHQVVDLFQLLSIPLSGFPWYSCSGILYILRQCTI